MLRRRLSSARCCSRTVRTSSGTESGSRAASIRSSASSGMFPSDTGRSSAARGAVELGAFLDRLADPGGHHVEGGATGNGRGWTRQLEREGLTLWHRDQVQVKVEDTLAAVLTVG